MSIVIKNDKSTWKKKKTLTRQYYCKSKSNVTVWVNVLYVVRIGVHITNQLWKKPIQQITRVFFFFFVYTWWESLRSLMGGEKTIIATGGNVKDYNLCFWNRCHLGPRRGGSNAAERMVRKCVWNVQRTSCRMRGGGALRRDKQIAMRVQFSSHCFLSVKDRRAFLFVLSLFLFLFNHRCVPVLPSGPLEDVF